MRVITTACLSLLALSAYPGAELAPRRPSESDPG